MKITLTKKVDQFKRTRKNGVLLKKDRFERKHGRPLARPSKPFTIRHKGIKVKVYLVPAPKQSRGDVIVVPRVHHYFGFLDHVDQERLSNGELWFTLHFDCISAVWFLQNAQRMAQPNFRFDQMAQDAGSCLIEVSLERAQLASINQRILGTQGPKPIQQVQVGTWWHLGEVSSPVPDSVVATKYLPHFFSTDPTTVFTSSWDVATRLCLMEVPPLQVLQALVATSHPGDLAQRYPGR
ncbi:hypothetical protein JY651_01810 [Pyxidicoccus parkwayensis]|uniref:Uncharacterized protein n=1 Tax=Pyxidicoccus parkwayensis TaxID=2813578 RepID=A0ABX7NYF9_9BACT|nr:hypothetical protein [Pyxidicoccus parkwaysis]QSQ23748.1 hypothetical protein JY651_01810 [Pyxidicoccus parkwaysis]